MRILSWNVNGLRACVKKGFMAWLARCRGDVVGVQEVRATVNDLPPEVAKPDIWHTHFVPAQRKGYSGVGLFARQLPDEVQHSLGESRFDTEGRLQLARFGKLWIANVYFPNGSGPNRDHSRIPYKLDFYRALFDRLEVIKENGGRVLVMGDFNTAHREIDLARPKSNTKTSGFCPEERAELDRWLKHGWSDTFRHFHASPENYTWWSQRAGIRERNVGWRIDYILASDGAMPFVSDAFIRSMVVGSDHCPIGVDVSNTIML
jgi:exodeoxyribonuclease III